jgi:hypothetical protein
MTWEFSVAGRDRLTERQIEGVILKIVFLCIPLTFIPVTGASKKISGR